MIHIHKYRISAVHQGRYVFLGGSGTSILLVCLRCQKAKVEVIDGWWTLEELTS
jgi:hypothetical protein